MEDKILIAVELIGGDTANRIQNLKKNIDSLSASQKELTKSIAENTRETDEQNEAYERDVIALAQTRAASVAYKNELKNLNKEIDNNVRKNVAAENSYEALYAEWKQADVTLKLLEGTIERNADGTFELTDKYVEQSKVVKDLKDGLLQFNKGILDGRLNVGNYDNSINGLSEKLSDLQVLFLQMDANSPDFEQTREAIQKTQGEIDVLKGKVNEFGEREPKNLVKKNFEDTMITLSLLNNAFEASSELLEGNEKAQKALATAALVTNGVIGAANILKENGAIIDTVAAAKTYILTGAQAAYAAVVGTSTGALRLFKIALASTGVGAIVVLLGELIFNFDKVNEYVNKFINFQLDLVDAVTGGNETIRKMVEIFLLVANPVAGLIKLVSILREELNGQAYDVEALNKTYDNFNKTLDENAKRSQNEIALRKAQGASENELAALTKKNLDNTVAERKKAFDLATKMQQDYVNRGKQLSEEERKLFDQVTADLQQSIFERDLAEAENTARLREEGKARTKEINEQAKIRLDILIKLQNDEEAARIEAITNDEQREIEAAKNNAKIKQDALDKEIAAIKGTEAQKQDIYNQAAITRQTIEAELQNKIADIQEKAAADKKAKDEAELQAAKDLADKKFNDAVAENKRILDLELRQTDLMIKDRFLAEQKKLQLILASNQKQLELAVEYAGADGKITNEEKAGLEEMQLKIMEVKDQLSTNEESATIATMLGTTPDQLTQTSNDLALIGNAINGIQNLISAGYQVRINQIETENQKEIEAIQNSTLSEEEKTEKIEALNKKAAKEQYKIQLEQFRLNKAISIIQTTISTASAVVAQLANPTPYVGFALAATAALTGAAQIALIASQPAPPPPSFRVGGGYDYDGGYTGDGSPYDVSNNVGKKPYIYHKKEYIVPANVLSTAQGMAHVSELERMRTGKASGMKGFFDGGFANVGGGQSPAMDINAIQNVVRATVENMPPIYVVATDVEKKIGEANVASVI